MLNGILWMAFMTAGIVGGVAMVMTQSFLWALVAYSGAGMAVMCAILAAEVLFGEAPAKDTSDQGDLATTSRG